MNEADYLRRQQLKAFWQLDTERFAEIVFKLHALRVNEGKDKNGRHVEKGDSKAS